MGGFFGVASKQDCSLDLFFGVDYHSHLGTRRGGLAVLGDDGKFQRSIHNIQNSPFRTKFETDIGEMHGKIGIGCISDFEAQPLLVNSHLGTFAVTTVGIVQNKKELVKEILDGGYTHFLEMSGGEINQTELIIALINHKKTILEGIKYVQEKIKGSITILVMTPEGIYGARDKFGRTPLQIGHKEGSFCLSFESHAYINLGYKDYKELGPGEIVFVNSDKVEVLQERQKKMKICTFLWIYYGNSHLGTFAVTTVGIVQNKKELVKEILDGGYTHFLEMSGGEINQTELIIALINHKKTILEGIKYVQEKIKGSITILVMTPEGIYGARDKFGRTPLQIGHKEGSFCLSFESHAYINLGYKDYKELGPGEIVFVNSDKVEVLQERQKKMKICTFLWIYYGYPTACYEGVNVEQMRYNCGKYLAMRDKESDVHPDAVAGVPDSGTAHAIGYANASGVPFTRPFIKYTPTWPRSFMPTSQEQRNLIAHMKLIPVETLIKGKKLLLIDDSIVRGTQLRETTDFLYQSGAKEVHVRPACPPIMFGCKYLNFSRSKSEMDLITRRVIEQLEGKNVSKEVLKEYSNPDSPKYAAMLEEIRKQLHFTTLRYHRLDDMLASTGLAPENLCTYCWNGEE